MVTCVVCCVRRRHLVTIAISTSNLVACRDVCSCATGSPGASVCTSLHSWLAVMQCAAGFNITGLIFGPLELVFGPQEDDEGEEGSRDVVPWTWVIRRTTTAAVRPRWRLAPLSVPQLLSLTLTTGALDTLFCCFLDSDVRGRGLWSSAKQL